MLVGPQRRLDRAPVLEVVADRVADRAHPELSGWRAQAFVVGLVLGPARPEVPDVFLDAVVPAEQGVDVAGAADDRIAVVRGRAEAVGREVDADAVVAVLVPGPVAGSLVPPFRVLFPSVLEQAVPAATDQDVVFPGPFEFHQIELRPLPLDSVQRSGQAGVVELLLVVARSQKAFILLDRPRGALGCDPPRRVPHLEPGFLFVVDHRAYPEEVPLPPPLRPDDGISLVPLRPVQYPRDALGALNDAVIDEELLAVADLDGSGN